MSATFCLFLYRWVGLHSLEPTVFNYVIFAGVCLLWATVLFSIIRLCISGPCSRKCSDVSNDSRFVTLSAGFLAPFLGAQFGSAAACEGHILFRPDRSNI